MIRERAARSAVPKLQPFLAGCEGGADGLAALDGELTQLALTPDALCLRPSYQLVQEGATPYEVYLLLDGEAEVTAAGGLVGTVGPGALIGAESAAAGTPSPVSVVTVGPTRVLAFGARAAARLLERAAAPGTLPEAV